MQTDRTNAEANTAVETEVFEVKPADARHEQSALSNRSVTLEPGSPMNAAIGAPETHFEAGAALWTSLAMQDSRNGRENIRRRRSVPV